ncbi:MAG: RES family NAD+ phosphorylase [Acidimicrobiales bacterium]
MQAVHHTLRSGTLVARIYPRGGRYPTTWRDFRVDGPLASARFDHHVRGERRGVLYGARDLITCVAEVFQSSRLVDRYADDRCFAAFRLARSVRLLDLTGDWPTRAGASQAIASGPRARAQAWARAIYDAYPRVAGLWYLSSMHGGHPALALFERAEGALPAVCALDVPLSHPGMLPDLTRAAGSLGYLLR